MPFLFFLSSIIHQFNVGDNNLCDLHEEVKTEGWAIGIVEKGVLCWVLNLNSPKDNFAYLKWKGMKLVVCVHL